MAATKAYDLYVDGLNDVLRALRKLPKEAAVEMRAASTAIADRHMAPAWRNAALNGAGPWGQAIADSVRVKKDRIPSVNIGYTRKVLSGGASSIMVRYPSDKGDRGRAAKGARNRMPAAFGSGTDWIKSAKGYEPAAMREWAQAVDQIVAKWSVL